MVEYDSKMAHSAIITPEFTQILNACSQSFSMQIQTDAEQGSWRELDDAEKAVVQIRDQSTGVISIDQSKRELDGESWRLRLTVFNEAKD